MMPPLLSVRNLSVGFGKAAGEASVVKDVSFDLAAGETLAIIGESGSGKSVTALSINRLVDFGGGRITSGEILLQRANGQGLDLAQAREEVLETLRGPEIAMIFQEPMTSLNPVFTVGEQIAEVIRTHRAVSQAEAAREAIELIKRVRIPDMTGKRAWAQPMFL